MAQSYKFSLNAEITMTRNSCPILLQSKNKSKILTLSIKEPKHMLIHCIPTNQILYEFEITKIKTVHSKYINEGKITLIIKEGTKPIEFNSLAVSADKPPIQDILAQVNISKACQQSLQIMIQNIRDYFTKLNKTKETKETDFNKKQNKSVQQKQFKKQTSEPSIARGFSRRDLLKTAKETQKRLPPKIQKSQKVLNIISKQKKNIFNFLPSDLILNIFSYSGLRLQYRLLSKQCSNIVLRGLNHLNLKSQIPQNTFQKLTKYCLKLSCRMKNIKSISHFVNNSLDGPYQTFNTKWLDFSEWRQIKNTNINELVGIRLYFLSLHYNSSITSSNLKNIKTTWLVFKSKNDTRNPQIKDDHIIQMINQFPQMNSLEIPFLTGDAINNIVQKNKMKILKIQRLEVNFNKFSWQVIQQFKSLQILEITSVINSVTNRIMQCSQTIMFPQSITTLKIGEYFNITNLQILPKRIKNLCIISQRVKNIHISNLLLPDIQHFNVSQCPLISPEAFYLYSSFTLIVRWDDFVIEDWKQEFKFKQIKIRNLSK